MSNLKIIGKPSTSLENSLSENLIDKTQLAQKLSLSKSMINKLMAERQIPFVKIKRAVRFRYSEVVAALQKWSAA